MKLPARTAHDATLTHGLVFVRLLTVVYGAGYLVLWHSWYGAAPARLIAPAAALGATAAFTVFAVRGGVSAGLLAVDLAVVVAIAGFAGLMVPPEAVGDAANWAFVVVGVASAAAAALLPATWWVPAAAAVSVAYGWGSWEVGLSGPSAGVPTRSVTLLVLLCTALAYATGKLRRHAADADERLTGIARRRSEEAAAEAQARDRREQERILHDTILNTLAGIAWGAAAADSRAAVRDRCRMDVTDIEAFLAAEPDHRPPADLRAALARAIDRARERGLAVDLRIHGAASVPPAVADALGAAVGEALSNVARHAGTSRAEVVASDEGVVVRDHGRGFEPRAVEPDRMGIRRSLTERMADVGGSATIVSSRGAGTTVTLRWAS